MVNYFSINKCLKLSVKTVVNFLFSLMSCLLQMAVEKDPRVLAQIKTIISLFGDCDVSFFRVFFMNSFIEIVECVTFKLISHSFSCLFVSEIPAELFMLPRASAVLCGLCKKKKKAAFYHDSCFILLFDSVTFLSVIYSVVFLSSSLCYLCTSALIASLTFLTVFARPSMRKGREWQSIWPCLSVCSGTPDISSSLHHRVRSQVVEFGSRVCHSPVSFSEWPMNHGQGFLLRLSCLGLT